MRKDSSVASGARLAASLARRGAGARLASESAKRNCKFTLSIRAPKRTPLTRFIDTHLRRARRLIESSLLDLSVVLVDDSTMSELHERFMGISGPTDVLTFPIDVARDGRVASGEIVICVPEARRQAKARGIDFKHELLLYALHGMLHLSGFDDRTERGFRRMHAKEDEILTRLGVGAVFDPAPARLRSAHAPVVARGACR